MAAASAAGVARTALRRMIRRMFRHNDVMPFIQRKAACRQCGKVNRVFVDDPALAPVCGSCRAAIPVALLGVDGIDKGKVSFDRRGRPLPPRPATWWRRVGREIASICVRGNLRTKAERQSERRCFEAASRIHAQWCPLLEAEWNAEQARLERERADQERIAREAEAAGREDDAPPSPPTSAEQRERTEALRREKERRDKLRGKSLAGRLEARLADAENLSGEAFEELVAEVLRLAGYAVEVLAGDERLGLVVSGRAENRLAVRARGQTVPVDDVAVQAVYDGMVAHDCLYGAIVSTAPPTRSANAASARTGVQLWTLNEMRRFVKKGQWFKL